MNYKPKKITDELVDQILVVRDTGKVNMFHIRAVMRVADEMELFKLVRYLEDRNNHEHYIQFILTGER